MGSRLRCLPALALVLAVLACSEEPPEEVRNHQPPATVPLGAADAELDLPEGEYEVGCAMCIWHVEDITRCTPAVKTEEGIFIIDGLMLEDEHALCLGSKKARLAGKVGNGLASVTTFTVIETDEE